MSIKHITTDIFTLSLHDALPISERTPGPRGSQRLGRQDLRAQGDLVSNDRTRRSYRDRKSTRLNSSHLVISYAVSCLKKKTIIKKTKYYSTIEHTIRT